MRQFRDKKTVCKLLQEAILQLCKVSVGLHGHFTIDGIICIAQGESYEHEVVVKIHEKIHEKQGSSIVETDTSYPIDSQLTNSTVNNEQHDVRSRQDHTVRNVLQPNSQNLINKSCKDQSGVIASGKQFSLIDDEAEILDISTEKQLFGEIDNFSDIECMGYEFDDLSFNDVVIKPDPCSLGKVGRTFTGPQGDDESSDEELKIETLKAGRVRKPQKGSYRDVHGAPVQVLSKEEFKRILKSEKLKRSRDKSPDFVSAQKVLKTSMDTNVSQGRPNAQPQNISLQSQVEVPKTIIGTLSYSQNEPLETNLHFSRPTASIVRNNCPSIMHQFPVNTGNNVPLSRLPGQIRPIVKSCVTQKPDLTNTSSSGVHIQNISNVSSTVNSYDIGLQNLCTVPQMNVKSLPSDSQKNSQQLFQISHSVFREPILSVLPPVQSKGNQQQHAKDNESSGGANIICLDTCNEATKSKAHECPVCAEVFDSFRLLDLHMYRLHPGMFLCPICGKSFKQRSTRNRHIVALHSSEKNFTCQMCNVAFTRTDTLKKHFSVHHPGVEIPKRPFSYSKGIAIQHQIHGIVSEQQNIENRNVYGEGVISPIQVTAAVESDISTSINITNITPTVSNEVFVESNHVRVNDTEAMSQNSSVGNTVESDSDNNLLVPANDSMADTSSDSRKNVLQSVLTPSSVHMDPEHASVKKHSNHVAPITPIELEQQLEHNANQIVQQSSNIIQNGNAMSSDGSIHKTQSSSQELSCDLTDALCRKSAQRLFQQTNRSLHLETNTDKGNDTQISHNDSDKITEFSGEMPENDNQNHEESNTMVRVPDSNVTTDISDSLSKNVVTAKKENSKTVSDIMCNTLSGNCNPIEISDEDTNDIGNVNNHNE